MLQIICTATQICILFKLHGEWSLGFTRDKHRPRSQRVSLLSTSLPRADIHVNIKETIKFLHCLSDTAMCVPIGVVFAGVLLASGMRREAYVVHYESAGAGCFSAAYR